MVQDNTVTDVQLTAGTEVPPPAKDAGGLPQLTVIEDGSFTNQVVWLFLTFFVLYFVVSKLVLPRVAKTLEEREDRIRGDLDKAEACRAHANEIQNGYEANLAEVRGRAQRVLFEAKAEVQAKVSGALKAVDEELSRNLEKAEAAIGEARQSALADLETVAADVSGALVERLAGKAPAANAVSTATAAAMKAHKES